MPTRSGCCEVRCPPSWSVLVGKKKNVCASVFFPDTAGSDMLYVWMDAAPLALPLVWSRSRTTAVALLTSTLHLQELRGSHS